MDEKEEIVARLATNLRYYRKQRDWSQSELAVRVGVDTRQIGRIEQQRKYSFNRAMLPYRSKL